VSPSRFDAATSVDAGGGTSEEHIASPPRHVPSALGLTFAVPVDTLSLTVETSWGRYAHDDGESADPGMKRSRLEAHAVRRSGDADVAVRTAR